jgi:hypothetical protein
MGDIPANCDFLYVYPGVEVSCRKITLEVIIYIVISICLSANNNTKVPKHFLLTLIRQT